MTIRFLALVSLALSSQAFAGAWSGWYQDPGIGIKSAQTQIYYQGRTYDSYKDSVTGAAHVITGGLDYNLGGVCTSDVSISNYGFGISIFCRGTDGALYTRNSFNGTNWYPWANLEGYIASAPSVESEGYGFMKICATGGNNVTWCRTWTN